MLPDALVTVHVYWPASDTFTGEMESVHSPSGANLRMCLPPERIIELASDGPNRHVMDISSGFL